MPNNRNFYSLVFLSQNYCTLGLLKADKMSTERYCMASTGTPGGVLGEGSLGDGGVGTPNATVSPPECLCIAMARCRIHFTVLFIVKPQAGDPKQNI